MADQKRNVYRELQVRPIDMRALLRLAIWGCAAAAALMVAVLSAYSTMGSQRVRITAAPPASQETLERSAPQPPVIAADLAERAAEAERETHRLSEAVLALSGDRERLVARIASLERSLEELTGSIRRQAAAVLLPG